MIDRRPLGGLLQKYDLLLGLHRMPAERSPARRAAMVAIAEQFPGALREWQALPIAELSRRRAHVQALMDGAGGDTLGGSEPWVGYSIDLHAWLRLILALRRWVGSGRGTGDDLPQHAAGTQHGVAQICAELGQPDWAGRVTPALIGQVRRPPGRQLATIAFEQVAAAHGVTVAVLKAALFPAGDVDDVVE